MATVWYELLLCLKSTLFPATEGSRGESGVYASSRSREERDRGSRREREDQREGERGSRQRREDRYGAWLRGRTGSFVLIAS